MQAYPSRDLKLSLCLKSAMIAKESAVAEFGIGEDLTFTLYGWKNDYLRLIGSMFSAHMKEPSEERARRLAIAGTVFRQAWGVDELVFMAEGFVSTNAVTTTGRSLRQAFVEKEDCVRECITFTHITQDGFEVVSLPYSTGLGRVITWHDILRSTDVTQLRDSIYPKILQMALRLEAQPEPTDTDTYYSILGTGLQGDGFSVQWDFD